MSTRASGAVLAVLYRRSSPSRGRRVGSVETSWHTSLSMLATHWRRKIEEEEEEVRRRSPRPSPRHNLLGATYQRGGRKMVGGASPPPVTITRVLDAWNEMLENENHSLRDRMGDLEKKVHEQNDEIMCLRSTLADVLRRLTTVEVSCRLGVGGGRATPTKDGGAVRLRHHHNSGGDAGGLRDPTKRATSYVPTRPASSAHISRRGAHYQSTSSLYSDGRSSSSVSPAPSPSPTQAHNSTTTTAPHHHHHHHHLPARHVSSTSSPFASPTRPSQLGVLNKRWVSTSDFSTPTRAYAPSPTPTNTQLAASPSTSKEGTGVSRVVTALRVVLRANTKHKDEDIKCDMETGHTSMLCLQTLLLAAGFRSFQTSTSSRQDASVPHSPLAMANSKHCTKIPTLPFFSYPIPPSSLSSLLTPIRPHTPSTPCSPPQHHSSPCYPLIHPFPPLPPPLNTLPPPASPIDTLSLPCLPFNTIPPPAPPLDALPLPASPPQHPASPCSPLLTPFHSLPPLQHHCSPCSSPCNVLPPMGVSLLPYRRPNGGSLHNLSSLRPANHPHAPAITRHVHRFSQLTREAQYNAEEGIVKLYLRGRPLNLYVPTSLRESYVPTGPAPPPPAKLKLEWVYGYRGRDCRNNVYQLPTGEIVYFVAAVVVLYNVEEQMQRHYLGHTDDIKCLAVHPNKLIIATGQTAGHDRRDARVCKATQCTKCVQVSDVCACGRVMTFLPPLLLYPTTSFPTPTPVTNSTTRVMRVPPQCPPAPHAPVLPPTAARLGRRRRGGSCSSLLGSFSNVNTIFLVHRSIILLSLSASQHGIAI
ncbi:Echinoderm microtubule-associated protein-like 1 [Chionoecetes opilio]|uniref:Echinoderm microtubule-associated protein-like 1 n=1 Tax=Chionoecetes opilio TaxID=41210 RepID=A0A8J8WFJ4_CHIOP|nr:Echinoderm microtubule-associated protein-like 1 [Chionoecetes opilio]